MSEVTTVSSLKDVLGFPFQGEDWQTRFIIGVALTFGNLLIPFIPAIFVAGYALRIMRQTVRGERPTLPPWDDWGEMAVDGLQVLLVRLAYLLPGLIVIGLGMVVYFVVSILFPFMMAGTDETGEAAFGISVVFLSLAIMFLSMAVGYILLAAGVIPLPMATAHFVARDEVSAAFRVGEWWSLLRGNKLGYFIAWVVIIGLVALLQIGMMLSYYTVILCWLIPFMGLPFSFYLSLVNAALFGQTYRESEAIQAGR